MSERKGFSGLSDLADNLGNGYESDEMRTGNAEGIYDEYEEDSPSDYEEEQTTPSQPEHVAPVVAPPPVQAPRPSYSSNQGYSAPPPPSGVGSDSGNEDSGLNWGPLFKVAAVLACLYFFLNAACGGPSSSQSSYSGSSGSSSYSSPSYSNSGSSYSSSNKSSSSSSKSNSSVSTSYFTSASDLVAEATRIRSNSESLGSFRKHGKVVVWDATRDKEFSPDGVNSSIIWGRGDDKGYVVYIDRFVQTRVSSYTSKRTGKTIPGIRKDAIVYVYDLKNRRCLGRARIAGENPPEHYRSRGTPQAIYGNIHRPVGNWLNRHFY